MPRRYMLRVSPDWCIREIRSLALAAIELLEYGAELLPRFRDVRLQAHLQMLNTDIHVGA